MKKFFSLILGLLLALGLLAAPAVAAESNITVILDGQELIFDVPPQIINGRTMVPMRKIGESLGAKVDWSEVLQTVFISTDAKLLSLHIGSSVMRMEIIEKDEVETVELDSNRLFSQLHKYVITKTARLPYSFRAVLICLIFFLITLTE